jgi:heterodisulfide reductase subunit B
VLAKDLGPAAIHPKVVRPLDGLRIAPYYGCQCLRPYAAFDDPEAPTSMEPLIRALGAEVFRWSMGGRCCGAANMNTQRTAGMELVAGILAAARGADALATVCPMCQMNLDAFQGAAGRLRQADLRIDVLYLPQLIGLALGLSEHELGLRFNFSVKGDFHRRHLKEVAPHAA